MLSDITKEIHDELIKVSGINSVHFFSGTVGENLPTSRFPFIIFGNVESSYEKRIHGNEHSPTRFFSIGIIFSVQRSDSIPEELKRMDTVESVESALVNIDDIKLIRSFLINIKSNIRAYVITAEAKSEEYIK